MICLNQHIVRTSLFQHGTSEKLQGKLPAYEKNGTEKVKESA
jgi:hypothetical protein